MTISPEFWAGRKVLVTGHTGFKGSWLSMWLQQLGAEVHGFALEPPTNPSLFVEAGVAHGMNSIIGDIREIEAIKGAMHEISPEIIFHMAAQPLVRLSYQEPVTTYSTNVMGLVHVLEAARGTPTVRAIVNVTTDKCYENREWVWGYRENEPMGGHDPYSNSKGCAELITSAYRRSFFQDRGVALGSARAGNVIGGGDWADDRLIPDILKAFENNQTPVIRNPNAIRPWQHVLEPLSGYLMLAQKLYGAGAPDSTYAEGWNFGPREGDSRAVEWIAAHMAANWGDEVDWKLCDGQHPHEATYLKLDISKAIAKLGWQPQWSLGLALKKIIIWHQAWLAGGDVRDLCQDQIEEYMQATQSQGTV